MSEVPDRQHDHGSDEGDEGQFGDMLGEAGTLPMDAVARQKARAKRKRLEELGGFGFSRPRDKP